MEQNIKKESRRVFKGKTEFTLTEIDNSTPELLAKTTEQRESDKRERHFYQRMLRAYCNGRLTFNFGRNRFGQPEEHTVLIGWE